ncbi:MAG: hypothetical protein U9N59_11665 [Campylobacterota bacterium]|nr:hypothetical protein [Campylobacterota bacterium]
MDNFKSQIKDKFSKEIDSLDLSLDIHTIEMRYNTIVENILETIKIKKEQSSIPMSETSNNNICSSEFNLCAGKSSDILLDTDTDTITNSSTIKVYKPKTKLNESSIIPDNFNLTYEMNQFAKSKFVLDVEEMFEDFKLYYQSKATINSDWEAVWKRWVLNKNKYKQHLIKTTIDEDIKLNKDFLEISKKYINKENRELEFIKFKNHYISNGDLKVSWEKVWENWCINHKQFKPKEQSTKQKQKADYRWDFRKAKDVSDRIKDWLEFEKGIKWLEDYYLKDISIPGIGWQDVMHPDFNKEEILLFKIDSDNGQFMLNNKSDDIIDTEVLENDENTA